MQFCDLHPHRLRTFTVSPDPKFEEKLLDVVGLYMNPPDKALVLCVDEKSQIQALNRTQPVLPLRPGRLEGRTPEYSRNGITSLFAALDTATGQVIGRCYRRHRTKEFVSFLKHIDRSTDPELDLHLILDNYATHKHPKVRAWLAKRERFHCHFTPTYSSWLNQVELWFGVLQRRFLQRGEFASATEFEQRLTAYLEDYNTNFAHPYRWTFTGQPLVRATPFHRTRRQQQHGRAWFSRRPKLFEKTLYPPRAYRVSA